jgi:DNA polymerase elongation subunit (family B)
MKFYTSVEQRRNDLLVRGYENGKRVQRRIAYKPYLFVPTKQPTQYKTLDGKQVDKVQFDSIGESRDFVKQYKDVSSFEHYGMNRWPYVYINDEYPGEMDFDLKKIRTTYLDIETDSRGGFPNIKLADKAITAITISDGLTYYTWALKGYVPHREDIVYAECASEKEMLMKFIRKWREMDADIVTGWNVEGFDIPYLYNRIAREINEEEAKKMSPWNMTEFRTYYDKMGREQNIVELVGLPVLDYFQLYQKFTYVKQEQWSLDYISFFELGEKKVDYRELGYENLDDLYQRNHQLYVEYNVKDVYLVMELEKKMKFIEQAVAIAYDAKVNYGDALTSVLLWDVIIHNYLREQNTVIPMQKDNRKDQQIAGAFVKDPRNGRYEWVVSFDLNSLYPHLIMQYNISPECYVETLMGIKPDSVLKNSEHWQDSISQAIAKNQTIAGNGAVFNRDKQGFLPALMKKYYEDRKRYKKMMIECQKQLQNDKGNEELERKIVQYNNMQMAKKISLNSAYGALSNQYFRFYSDDLAEAITLSGQVAIQWAMNNMNDYINKILQSDKDWVIASDTDSLYIDMSGIVNKFFADKTTAEKVELLDKICEDKIQPYIDKFYGDLATKMNGYEQAMQMKREAIAENAIWTGAKRYIMNVWNNEGVAYKEAKFKVVGIESVRSSTPTICRDAISDAAKIILKNDQDALFEYIEQFREKFNSANPADIARNSSVKEMSKYKLGDKGVPMHVKGALQYNEFLRKLNLTEKYPRISDGDKIKFVSLRVPNPAQCEVMAFPSGYLPPEFRLEKYIDREDHLKVGFLTPITTIATAGEMKTEKVATLEDFFS